MATGSGPTRRSTTSSATAWHPTPTSSRMSTNRDSLSRRSTVRPSTGRWPRCRSRKPRDPHGFLARDRRTVPYREGYQARRGTTAGLRRLNRRIKPRWLRHRQRVIDGPRDAASSRPPTGCGWSPRPCRGREGLALARGGDARYGGAPTETQRQRQTRAEAVVRCTDRGDRPSTWPRRIAGITGRWQAVDAAPEMPHGLPRAQATGDPVLLVPEDDTSARTGSGRFGRSGGERLEQLRRLVRGAPAGQPVAQPVNAGDLDLGLGRPGQRLQPGRVALAEPLDRADRTGDDHSGAGPFGAEQPHPAGHDDDQVRHRFQRLAVEADRARGAATLVVADRVEVAGRAQHPLAALLLPHQRGLDAVDHGGVIGQVGDETGDVGQVGQRREGGAAFEVDEHEAQQLRRVGQGQPGDQGPQQLALARSGRADDESVRAEAALRRLLDVEDHRLAVAVVADRYAQQPLGGRRVPARGDSAVRGSPPSSISVREMVRARTWSRSSVRRSGASRRAISSASVASVRSATACSTGAGTRAGWPFTARVPSPPTRRRRSTRPGSSLSRSTRNTRVNPSCGPASSSSARNSVDRPQSETGAKPVKTTISRRGTAVVRSAAW